MTATWLAALHAWVADASTRQAAAFATLAGKRAQLTAEIDRRLAQLGSLAERRDRPVDPQLHQRVVHALKAQQFDTLSVLDQRYAAKQFGEVTAAQMQAFLAALPGNWKTFATECLLRWDAFDQVQDRAAYTRLLCLAPSTVAFLHCLGRPQELVDPEGPTRLARAIEARDLINLRDKLKQRGFEPHWTYSAVTVARWFAARTRYNNSFASAWWAVSHEPALEAMLLPRLTDERASWFSTEKRPARVRQSVLAHATFVAALVRAAFDSGVDDAAWSLFTEKLLRSTFGDPRIPPLSHGWQRVQQLDSASYDRLLQLLIFEDITVFFEYAMQDPRRKEFWLGYVTALRRTTCIVEVKTKTQLAARLAGADERYRAAIARARTYETRGNSVAAFCLYFDAIVVVEFAQTGNAAQVYERTYFERHFEKAVQGNTVHDHTALKTSPSRADQPGVGPRILHTSGWEADTEAILARYGIARARR